MANPIKLESSSDVIPSVIVEARPEQTPQGFDLLFTITTDKNIIGMVYDASKIHCYPFQIATVDMSKALESDDFFTIHTLLSYIMPNLKEYCVDFLNKKSRYNLRW